MIFFRSNRTALEWWTAALSSSELSFALRIPFDPSFSYCSTIGILKYLGISWHKNWLVFLLLVPLHATARTIPMSNVVKWIRCHLKALLGKGIIMLYLGMNVKLFIVLSGMWFSTFTLKTSILFSWKGFSLYTCLLKAFGPLLVFSLLVVSDMVHFGTTYPF